MSKGKTRQKVAPSNQNQGFQQELSSRPASSPDGQLPTSMPESSEDRKESWTKKNLMALFAFGMTLVNFAFLNRSNWKADKIADYVSYANIVVKPRQSVFMTYTDNEYAKHKWDSTQEDNLHYGNTHQFLYYYQLYDSSKGFMVTSHSEHYDLHTIDSILIHSAIKGDSVYAFKVFEPKFQIINNGQTPARDFNAKIGVIQSTHSNEDWATIGIVNGPDIPAHDSTFPILYYRYPSWYKVKDTVYFWLRMRYADILGRKIENNNYVGYDPVNNLWLQGDTIKKMFGDKPFKDEKPK